MCLWSLRAHVGLFCCTSVCVAKKKVLLAYFISLLLAIDRAVLIHLPSLKNATLI